MANGDYWAKTPYFLLANTFCQFIAILSYIEECLCSIIFRFQHRRIVLITEIMKLYLHIHNSWHVRSNCMKMLFFQHSKKKTSKLIKTDCSSQIIWKFIKEHFENFSYMLWSVMAWDFQVWRWKLPLWWKWFILHSFGHLQHFVGHKRLATNKKLWESAIWTLAVGRIKCQYNG